MSDLNKEEEFTGKVRQLHDEIRRVKCTIKEVQERHKEVERVNQEQHLILLAMEERSRRLQALITTKTR
jgi:hypothetical protein